MDQPRPIIIKRVKGHGGHHGGAWKVAYADFVTAMMALFIVLWLMNSSKAIQKAVGGYFRDPTGASSDKVGSGQTGAGENFMASKENMNQIKDALEAAVKRTSVFEKLKDQIEMTVTADGLRVELMEKGSSTFFESGVAGPTADCKEILRLLAQELGKLPNDISIEGHTDSKPYLGRTDYGNWELSVDRANAARRWMEETGLREDQVVQVRGYADKQLRRPQAPEDPSNRRISVIVHHRFKPDAADANAAKPANQAVSAQAHAAPPAAASTPAPASAPAPAPNTAAAPATAPAPAARGRVTSLAPIPAALKK